VTTETVVARLIDLEAGTARRVQVNGRPVALVRCGDDVYAISDICSHANVSLSEGEILCADREIECWKHGSTFSLVDGEPQSLPATQPVPVYEVEVRDGDVIVRVPS
jgi:3-phenylpropionate/trans-cinnamate dioxygenase ferredoxin subunit